MKNKKMKKVLSFIVAVIMLVGVFPIAAVALETDDGYTYTVESNNEVTINAYNGTETMLVMPDTISGYPVTKITGNAFSLHCNTVTEVYLPAHLKQIGIMTFFTCDKLTIVHFNNELEYIGAYAFARTNLSGDIVLPETVTDIGADAFGRTQITSLHLGKNVKPVSAQTDEDMWKYKSINLSGVNTKYEYYFEPYTTMEHQKNIAQDCPNLTKVTVDVLNPNYRSVGGVLFNKGMTEMYCYPSGKTASTYFIPLTVKNFYDSFSGFYVYDLKVKNNASAVILPKDLTDLMDGTYALERLTPCGKLDTVVIPNNVKTIEFAAFYNTNIKNIFIPASITSINGKAFWHCQNLTTVGFDRNSVYTELPKECFKDCENLKNVTFGKIDYLSALVFENCKSLESVDLTNVLGIESTAFDGCENLSEITYRDTDDTQKATVSESAFDNTASLKTVMLGSSVGKVEANAFSNCANLNTAYISQEITDIDDTAFENCENLTIICDSEQSYAYQFAVKNNIAVTTMILSPIANQTYTGEEIKPELTVKSGDKILQDGVDYDLYFEDNIDAGTASVIVFGKGNYNIFACVGKFAIMQRDINDSVKIGTVKDVTATGEALEPEVTMAYQNYILQKDLDYTVNYSNNVGIGKGEIVITGTGNFCGTLTKEFNITEKAEEDLSDIIAGDGDGDGNITIIDYAMAKSSIFSTVPLSNAQMKAFDVNGDGAVDMFDIAEIDLMINKSK